MKKLIEDLDQLKTAKLSDYNKVLKRMRDIQNERFDESVADTVYYNVIKPSDHPDFNIKRVNFFKEKSF